MTSTEIIIAFFISLIAGYIVIHIPPLKLKSKDNLELDKEPSILFNKIEENHKECDKELIRQHNRRVRDEKLKYFTFSAISFLLIGASFYYPMFFNGFLKSTIDLTKTKLGIDFILNKDDLFVITTVYASILYIPILYISNQMAYLYQWLQRNYHNFSNGKILIIRLIVTLFFSFLLGATIYWILNINIVWWDAVKFTFSILLIPILFAINQ